MQYQKCSLELYTQFLYSSQRQFSGAELARVAPIPMARDAVSRWLRKSVLTPKLLWKESQPLVDRRRGYLVIDDTVLDKPYARQIPLVKAQYSGKHHGVVRGIDLVNLLWTDGERVVPVDYRVYDPTTDGHTKNDHAVEMLGIAKKRLFEPQYVLMDAWFTSIGNLKKIDRQHWKWIGALKSNRSVSPVKGRYVRVSDLDWSHKRLWKVWLKAYGFVLVSKIVAPNGDIAYIATNDVSLEDPETLKTHYGLRWTIETFHRGLKQCTGIERCHSTIERSQRNHLLAAFLAFLRLEWERIERAISWYEQKWAIPRMAVTAYLGANA